MTEADSAAAVAATAAKPAMNPAIALDELSFGWEADKPLIKIDHFEIARGATVFLRGASGSGKSTLLALIGGVLTPGAGTVRVLDQDLGALSQGGRDRFRSEHIGFIFQQFNLLPYLSVLENVTLATNFSSRRAERARSGAGDVITDARRLLEHLGISGPLLQRPVSALSIGQQQRVAAARALIGRPELIIADEPTSALDHDARGAFLELLIKECEEAGTTLLFVSHDPTLKRWFSHQVSMEQFATGVGADD